MLRIRIDVRILLKRTADEGVYGTTRIFSDLNRRQANAVVAKWMLDSQYEGHEFVVSLFIGDRFTGRYSLK